MRRIIVVLILTLIVAAIPGMTSCAPAKEGMRLFDGSEWHDFQGTWTAAGSRSTLDLGDRRASIARFEGSLVLTGTSTRGFRSETMVFSDTSSGLIGRAVWTDERGEKVFSDLRGEGTATKNKISGTFTGGTGPYQGATGTYEFSWRFVLENEEGAVQGQSVGLVGRIHVESPKSVQRGPQS